MSSNEKAVVGKDQVYAQITKAVLHALGLLPYQGSAKTPSARALEVLRGLGPLDLPLVTLLEELWAQLRFLPCCVGHIEELGNAGDPTALWIVGLFLFWGPSWDSGYPEYSYAEAWNTLHKAAMQGNAAAQLQLGLCYLNGATGGASVLQLAEAHGAGSEKQRQRDGVKQRSFIYHFYYGEQAAWLCAEGLRCLGQCYHLGEGVKEDLSQALTWYEAASALGHREASFNLWHLCLELDKSGTDDSLRQKGLHYLKTAAEQGHRDAQYEFATTLLKAGTGQPLELAVEFLEKAAAQGSREALEELARCYASGRGVPKDLKKAVQLYRQAGQDPATECSCPCHGSHV